MEESDTCANCEYWGQTSNVTGSTSATAMGCRKHAPVGTGIDDWKWPPTKADDWCGDFKLGSEKQR